MSFNSSQFALFLPIVLLLFSAVYKQEKLRDGLLLIASYIFYMAWYWQYAGLIAMSTIVDYYVAQKMGRENRERVRKLLMISSLVVNLGLLGLFKYFNFFVDTTTAALSHFGLNVQAAHLNVLLPVGISFYTFQTLSYTIDVYRRRLEPEKNLVKFAVFVSFFPQLVAGPIVRASDFLPQLHRDPVVTRQQFNNGLKLVFWGLFKKIVIADMLAHLAVDTIFSNPTAYSSWDLMMGLYAYTFQIYCDFSGYSDIAIGTAAMFGYILPQNFNRPYLSQNVREFWTRWHITLSTWLRDYLYISLGGNRGSKLRVAFNLMVTMLLGGLWHGAALNFVIWGGYHGILLILARKSEKFTLNRPIYEKIYKQIMTFHFIVFSWLLFRVSDMHNFTDYLSGLSHLGFGTQLSPLFYLILGAAIVMHIIPRRLLEERIFNIFIRQPAFVQAGVYAGMLLLFLGVTLDAPSFIYFQF